MTDNLNPEDRHKAMKAVKGKDTSLERRLFAMLAGMRINGWRKNAADIIGKPDVVFNKERVAIFVDGCFWHGCPVCKRSLPKTNHDYWERKINRNVELINLNNRKLEKSGWAVLRFWEHEIRKEISKKCIREKIMRILTRR